MKTTLSDKAAFAATALLASLLTANTYAGPGPQYWANANRNAAKADEAKPAATVPVCPGSQEVAVTVMKPAWPNGRGPLAPVQIGTKRVCTVCPVTGVATAGWANGRGPQTKSATSQTGVPHTCTINCPPTKA